MSARHGGLLRLPDGTPYFGQLAELACDRDGDRVQCHLCGEWFRWLGSSHLRRTQGWVTSPREARIPPDQLAAIEFGQALAVVGTAWEYAPAPPYDHHACFSQVLDCARQFPGHAYANARSPQALDDAELAA